MRNASKLPQESLVGGDGGDSFKKTTEECTHIYYIYSAVNCLLMPGAKEF